MLKNEFHRLLQRQLKKSGLDITKDPKYADFLNVVNDAYKSFDKDVKHIENILEESSKELFVANQKLTRPRLALFPFFRLKALIQQYNAS